MPRQTADQQITTRAARDRLPVRKAPYWKAVDTGAAVGYRKAQGGGHWFARAWVEERKAYVTQAVGTADDALKPDGTTVLDYRQAVEKAKAWGSRQHHIAAGHDPDHDRSKPYTVADAMSDYVAAYKRRGGKALTDTQRVITAHILPSLGAVRLDKLTRSRVAGWLNGLADSAPRLRSKRTATSLRFKAVDAADTDAPRRRRATANRILTILKAALNHARHEARFHGTDDAWGMVKPFKAVDAPKIRYLSDAEITRLVNVCPDDLRRIVTAALVTGMRYGEIAVMKPRDLNIEGRTITVPVSKSGRSRNIHLNDEGLEFLIQNTTGRPMDARTFNRDDGTVWAKSSQCRPLLAACKAASITPAVSFHILRHTYASRLVMRGTQMEIISAQLGHEDTRITARHYAHLSPSYIAATIRANSEPMGIVSDSNVSPLHISAVKRS